jgi:hypothetical protein
MAQEKCKKCGKGRIHEVKLSSRMYGPIHAAFVRALIKRFCKRCGHVVSYN